MGSSPTRPIQKLINGRLYSYEPARDLLYRGDVPPASHEPDLVANRIAGLCVEVTTRCNLTCANCFSNSARGRAGVHLEGDMLIRYLRERVPDLLRIVVTGGEPLFHPDIESLLELPACGHDCGWVLCTNGTPRPDLDELIVEHEWLVVVSLHGREVTHNRYTGSSLHRIAARRIRRLAGHGRVHVAAVLHDRMSAGDIDWLFSFRDDSGAAFLRLIVPRSHGRYRPLANHELVEHAMRRLDDRASLKSEASATPFLDAQQRLTVTH